MKIKSLLLGMFACAALAACSNEDIVEGNGNGNEEGNAVPAYVSLSFTAKTTGDGRANNETPADPDDTGINNDGTVKESQVKSLAVLIGNEVSEYYADVATAFTKNNMGIYVSNAPYKVTAGTKDILVVLNPTAEIVAKYTPTKATATEIREEIENGTYENKSTFAAAINGVTAEGEAFMMANRQRVSVTATDKNTVDNPVIAEVNVERCVAKFTFRTTNDNQYPVTVTTVKSTLVNQEIKGTTYYKAKDANDMTVWYTLKEGNEVDVVYAIDGDNVQVLTRWNGTGLQPTNSYALPEGKTLTYMKEDIKTDNKLTITLEGYYLSNLQNKMYNVRHISSNGTSGSAFGLLNGSNYLFDPYFTDKNATNVANPEYDYSQLFFNPYVSLTTNAMFTSMPTGEGSTSSDSKNVGSFMSYCFENAAISNMQKHGYSTSITFKAVARFADNKTFNGYIYNNVYYATLEDCQKANPGVEDTEIAQFENGVCYYTTQIKHLDNNMANAMGNMEFAVVRNNIYSLAVSTLKNIGTAYIDGNDPTQKDQPNKPDIDDETGEGNIQLNVKIIPWVVRYNNIEF